MKILSINSVVFVATILLFSFKSLGQCAPDVESPTASNPATTFVECIFQVPLPDVNVVVGEMDNCTATPIVQFVGEFSDSQTCPETISRTYSITDDAFNQTNVTHLIVIMDNTLPTASNPLQLM